MKKFIITTIYVLSISYSQACLVKCDKKLCCAIVRVENLTSLQNYLLTSGINYDITSLVLKTGINRDGIISYYEDSLTKTLSSYSVDSISIKRIWLLLQNYK